MRDWATHTHTHTAPQSFIFHGKQKDRHSIQCKSNKSKHAVLPAAIRSCYWLTDELSCCETHCMVVHCEMEDSSNQNLQQEESQCSIFANPSPRWWRPRTSSSMTRKPIFAPQLHVKLYLVSLINLDNVAAPHAHHAAACSDFWVSFNFPFRISGTGLLTISIQPPGQIFPMCVFNSAANLQ